METTWRCLVGILASPVYLCLTLVALSSFGVSFLKDLSSHGKTRVRLQHDSKQTQLPNLKSLWKSLLYSENFLIHKRYFLHFYVVGFLSLVGFFSTIAQDDQQHQLPIAMLLGTHLLRRCYECLFIHRCSDHSKMHLAGYFLGVFYYLLLPFIMFHMTCDDSGPETDNNPQSWLGFSGLLFCLWGQYEQYQHHFLLSTLRPTTVEAKDQEVSKEHKIPRGRWFDYVSCPHYLAEILIYLGFLVVIQGAGNQAPEYSVACPDQQTGTCTTLDLLLPNFLRQSIVADSLLILRQGRVYILLLWVVCNLTVSAIHGHEWYLQSFPTYHSLNRKAIFPGIL